MIFGVSDIIKIERKIYYGKKEVLTVTFCSDGNGEAGLGVFKESKYKDGDTKIFMINMETGEQAEILYRLLTDPEETVTDILKKYHTCGRCKYEHIPEYKFPCGSCMHGIDLREDLWEAKEDE